MTSKTTPKRRKTFWPLVLTSTTSTSRMESATCSTYHNHVYQHLQSSMVLHLHSQNGLVNCKHTSTAASLSTSTSWISPTMRKYHLQQRSWYCRQLQDIDNIQRLLISLNVHYLQEQRDVEKMELPTARYNRSPTTSMHNKHFRTLPQQEYVEQANFLVTSSRTRQSRTANQTTY